MEQWKIVENYPNYEVSSEGKVRNKKSGHALSPMTTNSGYWFVHLSLQGKVSKQYIHRLVATAFAPTDETKNFVNHINGNKKDNRAENLEWVTVAENLIHASRVLGARRGNPKRKVLCVETGKTYESASEAAKTVNGSIGTLAGVCRGVGETYKGYHWKYIT